MPDVPSISTHSNVARPSGRPPLGSPPPGDGRRWRASVRSGRLSGGDGAPEGFAEPDELDTPTELNMRHLDGQRSTESAYSYSGHTGTGYWGDLP
jgi:hypothetical protein